MRLAFTADLHWGSHANGDEATLGLVSFLQADPPDVLVLAGDIGAGEHFAPCLALFESLPCRKALVPGNHDIWVAEDDPRGDSLEVYRSELPRLCAEAGFHYLDQGPLCLSQGELGLVGSINWYDYSWAREELKRRFPDHEERLRSKQFSRGRHNDARFVRWLLDDRSFTSRVVATLEQHLQEALAEVEKAIVVTHHPPFYRLGFPHITPSTSLDSLLWDAFAGNQALEDLLGRQADRIPFAFCGHTHRARENRLESIEGFNIGGDYHFKRLLLLDWPGGKVTPYTFGEP